MKYGTRRRSEVQKKAWPEDRRQRQSELMRQAWELVHGVDGKNLCQPAIKQFDKDGNVVGTYRPNAGGER